MATAVCGCTCAREPDGSWVVALADRDCALGHHGGEHGWEDGPPSRVTGVGVCVCVVFERDSRTALLTTRRD